MGPDTYDLIVIGGGSGGSGAALTAGRLGLRTLWVEKEAALGGTGVQALVNVWQPSYGRSVFAREIAERLLADGGGGYASGAFDTPSGRPLYRTDPTVQYDQTLSRWTGDERRVTSPLFVYQPEAMSALLAVLARETGHVEVATDCAFLEARVSGRRIEAVRLMTPEGERLVRAGWFVDATADIHVARDAGCAWTIGREAHEVYGEPSAGPAAHGAAPADLAPEFKLNGWTLCFTVAEGPDRVALPGEGWGPESDWAHIGQMPAGGYTVNLCFQMPGEVGWRLGPEQARELLLGNIARRWPGVRRAYGLEAFGITQVAPRIGVREGPRLLARYVLTEHDHRAGNCGAQHDDCIAWTDHAMDRHSVDGGVVEAEHGPVGVPLRCLQPVELDNLLVACRGAGFSSLAASAARLQRTMMELGEAAGRMAAGGGMMNIE
jgi:hypothetical protein